MFQLVSVASLMVASVVMVVESTLMLAPFGTGDGHLSGDARVLFLDGHSGFDVRCYPPYWFYFGEEII